MTRQLSVRGAGRLARDLRLPPPITRCRCPARACSACGTATTCSTARCARTSASGRVRHRARAGALTIRTPLETCKVSIGGRDLGFPPITDQKLAAGNYRVRACAAPTATEAQISVTIEAGQAAHESHPMTRRAAAAAGAGSPSRCCCVPLLGARRPGADHAGRVRPAPVRQRPRVPRERAGTPRRSRTSRPSSTATRRPAWPTTPCSRSRGTSSTSRTIRRRRRPRPRALLKKFPASDSVPMAYVVAGQAMVARGLTPANVDAALASFERVPRLFPGQRCRRAGAVRGGRHAAPARALPGGARAVRPGR